MNFINKKSLKIAVVSSVLSTLLACSATDNQPDSTIHSPSLVPSIANIKGHMSFLADDLLEGRDTGSNGHELASLYIATEFKKYGLQAGGKEQSYFQRIKFRKSLLVQESPSLSFVGENGFSLDYPKDFLVGPNSVYTDAAVSAPLVFVGYGIVSEELNHDDYKDIDVEGKVVVMLSGKPASFPSEEGAHIASTTQKRKYAVARGAVGIISLQTPSNEEVRPYQRSLSYIHVPSMRWLGEDGVPGNVWPELKAGAYLNLASGKRLFKDAPRSLEDIFAELEEDKSPKGFDLPLSVDLSYQSTHDDLSSPNVAGILEGSDPILKDEFIVFTAHSDHIGIAKSVKKDRINNGAMDNAGGVSVMLETARLFANLPERPKRSILFLAVTGEEKGLLGADYFAQNPTINGEMVANVNLDMPLLTYEFADVIAFGASHSTMGESVNNATQNAGIKLTPDPWPKLNLFTRSDHYSFVKQGVPAIFLVTGIESKTPDIDGSQVLNNFLATNYHKPSDDMSQAFVWKAADTFTRVNFEIGLELANQDAKPAWYRDSFFGKTFGKHLTDR
ncbi:M28 family metallopeptidase [Agaribacter flavus]|uniref:M28 family metallopeptidase n=1 Tax=Agaribacter flavus TaxID=1902781 RepID=A0ABV7FRU3_9ALTE